ncbi:hypothetical protein CMV_006781 [Castanea mollissima]|uniref:Uncharacterized protein n=1 Tax=Castanea mollissima TaxID=60419 RepID=A0A8J4RGF0_9ROSI|nr:hypothetical protein CMV_006781 [Castanea mollissima]
MVIVGAKKNHKNKKPDTHSFVPKPEEATEFFPEAVLLREKKFQDGEFLPEFADAEEQNLYETPMLQLESETVVEQNFFREKKGKIWKAKWINDFKSMLDKDERVIRHLVIKRDEAITEDCPQPPEFHTLRGDMDDYDKEEDDIDYDEEDEEDDIDEIDGHDDDLEDGIIVVEDETEDISTTLRNKGGKSLRAEKVSR